MFELQKLITVALALILLAPFGFVFWHIAKHRPRPEAEVKAQLEAALQKERERLGTTQPDGSVIGGIAVQQVEAIAFSKSTASWLSFYPRRWAGVVGLISIAAIVVCVIMLLFFPAGAQVRSEWNTLSPEKNPATLDR